jgi:Cu-processing system permease protein
MDALNVAILLRKELRDGLRDRWLWLFAAVFGALALAVGSVSLVDAAGTLGFSRTVAGLINLTLLLVPLVGLSLGAQSVAGERDRRTLPYLLAQPIGRVDLLLGKYLGLGLALATALGLGFGAAGLLVAQVGANAGVYTALAGLAVLLGLASLSLGLLISVLARRSAVAVGVGVVVWFGLVLLGDLGLMGTAVALQLRADTLFLLALLNPLEAFKLAAVLAIQPSLEVLGPAGLYGAQTFGAWLGPMLVGLLVAWCVLPLGLAGLMFRRKGEP